MKIRTTIFLFLVILLILSCKKNSNELVIRGTITDASSGAGIEGVEIKISKNGLNNGSFNPTYSLIETNYSEGNGTYEIIFTNQSAGEYKIDLKKAGYLNATVFLSSEEVLANQPFPLDKALLPSGQLQLSIENSMPQSEEDFISFQLSDYGVPCSCCPIGMMEFNGPVIDYESTCTLPAERWQRYMYFYLKNGSSSTVLDSIWIDKGQTSVLTISF